MRVWRPYFVQRENKLVKNTALTSRLCFNGVNREIICEVWMEIGSWKNAFEEDILQNAHRVWSLCDKNAGKALRYTKIPFAKFDFLMICFWIFKRIMWPRMIKYLHFRGYHVITESRQPNQFDYIVIKKSMSPIMVLHLCCVLLFPILITGFLKAYIFSVIQKLLKIS